MSHSPYVDWFSGSSSRFFPSISRPDAFARAFLCVLATACLLKYILEEEARYADGGQAIAELGVLGKLQLEDAITVYI